MILVKYNKNTYKVLDLAMSLIPPLRDGKSDVGAIISFVQDVEMYRKFRVKYLDANINEQKELIIKWNDFIAKRESENYIPQRNSQHCNYYYTLF